MARPDVARAPVRRWRLAAFAGSLGLTLTAAVASAAGMVTAAPAAASIGSDQRVESQAGQLPAAAKSDSTLWPVHAIGSAAARLRAADRTSKRSAASDRSERTSKRSATSDRSDRTRKAPAAVLDPRPPRRSGAGRRAVFDQSAQQVWLVRESGTVRATYLVSGSRLDNLTPGRYEVYSRSHDAVSFDYSSTMRYMVRFTQGDNAAIGFHDIPVDKSGQPVQTGRQLGVARSSGCIRQRPSDAREMWDFAQLGTDVVVVA